MQKPPPLVFAYVHQTSIYWFGADSSQLMNGRWFDERQLEAYIATGNEKFKKSSDKKVGFVDEEDEEEEGGRLDKFGSWLEEAN
jgi:hypothetical protein